MSSKKSPGLSPGFNGMDNAESHTPKDSPVPLITKAQESDRPPAYDEALKAQFPESSIWSCSHYALDKKCLQRIRFEPNLLSFCENRACNAYISAKRPDERTAARKGAGGRIRARIWKLMNIFRGRSIPQSLSVEDSCIFNAVLLFSSPSPDELGICLKDYFTVQRVNRIMQDLNIPLCRHLQYNSPYILNTFPAARELLHSPILSEKRRSGGKRMCCSSCPEDTNVYPAWSAYVEGGWNDCWNCDCGLRFQWIIHARPSRKTKAKVVCLGLFCDWDFHAPGQSTDLGRWAPTVPHWTVDKYNENAKTWHRWLKHAEDLEREWLKQTPRRLNCTLGPAQSCLRPAWAPDPGFEEPSHRH